MEDVLRLIEVALGFVPIVVVAAPAIALLVDLGKKIGLVKDGKAGMWSLGLNAAFWVVLYFAGQLGIGAEAEEFIRRFAEFAPAVIALVSALLLTPAVHNLLVPRGIGYSYSRPTVRG